MSTGTADGRSKGRLIADQQWRTVKREDKQNEEVLNLSNQILELTKAIHMDMSSPTQAAPSSNEFE